MGYSEENILKLETHTKLKYHQYVEILLDWIKNVKPEKDTVLRVYNTIKQDHLEYWYMMYIKVHLKYKLDYKNIPVVIKLPSYQYTDMWRSEWYLTSQQCDMLTKNDGVKLTGVCDVQDCRYYKSKSNKHTVTIQLGECNGQCVLKVLTTDNIDTDEEHVHDINICVTICVTIAHVLNFVLSLLTNMQMLFSLLIIIRNLYL